MPRTLPPRVRKLREKRELVVQELRSLDREITQTERALGVTSRRRPAAVYRRPNARRMNDITVKDAVVQLLRQKRKPMHYQDITHALLKEGRYRTKSKNFLSTVAITIMRDKRLKRVEPGVYALRSRA